MILNKMPLFFLTILTITFLSCGSDNSNQRIIGKWQGISWHVKGQPSGRDAADVSFEFNADDTYSAAFGQQKETGVFDLTDNKLYTTATGQAKKMVEIHLPTLDTMVMDMNRAGTMEELILVKK